ncbi:MAG: hypothetical protein ACK55Z_28350, partial [bacterium]
MLDVLEAWRSRRRVLVVVPVPEGAHAVCLGEIRHALEATQPLHGDAAALPEELYLGVAGVIVVHKNRRRHAFALPRAQLVRKTVFVLVARVAAHADAAPRVRVLVVVEKTRKVTL